jgi:hypothetical protein
MKTITFNNVSISIEAPDAKEAYTKLCNMFTESKLDIEYTTDTFSEDDVEKSTEQLF